MPIIKSAKKALRQARTRTLKNRVKKDAVKEAIKNLHKLISAKKADELEISLSAAYQAIDKAAKSNLIHKNKAARMKSHLAHLIKTN